MGYDADFEFDLVIAAEHVEKATKILWEKAKGQFQDSDHHDFCSAFMEAWGEGVGAVEDKPTPLAALASGKVRGDIHISGETTFWRWGDWEEPLMTALAPYIKPGGTIEITSHCDDYRGAWKFDGKIMYDAEQLRVDSDEFKALQEKAGRLEKAEALLRRLLSWESNVFGGSEAPVWGDVRNYFESKAPLEQLADCAE